MIEYPKIETLYDRDERTHKVLPDKIRLPEFELISRWLVTEKIDGTNIRVHLRPDGSVGYGGRTDAAQLYVKLVEYLYRTIPVGKVRAAFDPGTEAVLFGEGYGPKIQKGGGDYRADVAFRLFDVAVMAEGKTWWLTWDNVEDVARKLGVATVPVLARGATLGDALGMIAIPSKAAFDDGGKGCVHEGVVCRTDPPLFTRKGHRLFWKLKGRDFAAARPTDGRTPLGEAV